MIGERQVTLDINHCLLYVSGLNGGAWGEDQDIHTVEFDVDPATLSQDELRAFVVSFLVRLRRRNPPNSNERTDVNQDRSQSPDCKARQGRKGEGSNLGKQGMKQGGSAASEGLGPHLSLPDQKMLSNQIVSPVKVNMVLNQDQGKVSPGFCAVDSWATAHLNPSIHNMVNLQPYR
jgi:hypothetical protein